MMKRDILGAGRAVASKPRISKGRGEYPNKDIAVRVIKRLADT